MIKWKSPAAGLITSPFFARKKKKNSVISTYKKRQLQACISLGSTNCEWKLIVTQVPISTRNFFE